MEPAEISSMEDQWSKLHPRWPLNTRIAIIGGGPSGLSAAYALCKLGYNNVTLLEKYHTVSGMCESANIEGQFYDLGGQVLAASSSPTIFSLAKEIGCEMEEMDSHKMAVIDSYTGKYQDIKVADDYVSVISLTLQLEEKAKKSGRIGVHALSDLASDLTPAFLNSRGLKSVPESVAYGYTASGYGFVQDMPYAYIHEFTRTSMGGKIRRFKGGYMKFWQKISESLPVKVLCNTEVITIKRCSPTVTVDVKQNGDFNSFEFDKLIISGAFPFVHGKTYRSPSVTVEGCDNDRMDFTELEKELFGKVQTIDYYTTVMKIKGLEHFPVGFYYFGEFMDDPGTIGNPVAMQRFYSDTDVFLFWSYGNSAEIKGPQVIQLAVDAIERMGGKVERTVLQRRFKYFPHVESQDMKDGFYDRFETQLQGENNTYYIGGLMAFELTERNSSYAMTLVQKHFACDDPLPRFPYVKTLFPMMPKCYDKMPRKLDESEGVDFPDLSTLDCYLKHWGTHNIVQSKILYTWINDEGEAINTRTYAELHANATCIAEKLLSSCKPVIRPRDRVLLVHVPGLEFIDAFFGCLRAGILPVPLLPPDPLQRGGQALSKIENVAKSCNAVAILSTMGYHSAVRAGFIKNLLPLTNRNGKSNSARWPNLPWLHTDSWIRKSKGLSAAKTDSTLAPQGDDLCFLQFTSGSTGDAKGVMITHGGLIHNVKLMRKRYRSTSNTVLVSWLPQYHDMGLIGGLFTALVSGGTAILFSPMTFIKNSLLWLETITKYKGTHSAGPNFAFELMIRRLELDKKKVRNYDLSSMVFLMVAAEPVRKKTLKRFIELTTPYGLSQYVMAPGYGLAENCVFVSCAYGEGKPVLIDWQGRVSCGYVDTNDSDVDIRMVDPQTGEECIEPGKEGEIWIHSPSAGIGYWGKEELSDATFRNELMNHPHRIYTRTGDLGRIIDGNLLITGRIKDLIIVAGRNIYSADVEKTVEGASDIIRPGCCAVIGVPEEILLAKGISFPEMSDQVGLVAIAEVRDGKPVNKDVIEQIKVKVSEEHGVTLAAIKLIKPRTISKTTSGKIKRFECLKHFTEETLSLVPQPIMAKRSLTRCNTTGTCMEGYTPRMSTSKSRLSYVEIVEYLKKLVSEQTGIHGSKISTSASLTSYGIDSIGVVRAAQKLSDFLGVQVGAVDIFTATNIEDLASFSESLMIKNQPQDIVDSNEDIPSQISLPQEISLFGQLHLLVLQFLALAYVSILLILPAYLTISVCTKFIPSGLDLMATNPNWMFYMISLAFAPLAWILCIFATCICISIFGNSFLQPNYALSPNIAMWSMDYIKWWALYKAQEMSSKVWAVHLRGTVLLNYWFQMFGAKIGSSVVLDTIDITDPALVSIGDGVVIAEGALLQSHEVRDGILSFNPIRIGKNSSVGPYAVIQKGSVLRDGTEVPPLQVTNVRKLVSKSNKANNIQEVSMPKISDDVHKAIYHLMGLYTVGFISSLSAAIVYWIYILLLAPKTPNIQHFMFVCIAGAFHWFPLTIIAYVMIITAATSSPLAFSISVAIAYSAHGLILSLLTCLITNHSSLFGNGPKTMWLRHRIIVACHLRFAKFLSGTEAFCIYLRLLGAKVGKYCSIRAINPILEPEMVSIGAGVHLGDFSRIIPGFYSSKGFTKGKIEVQENSVVGSQSLVLPGATVQKEVILGAISVAPINSVLQRGGVYIGSQSPIMIKNTMIEIDDRIEEMDVKYKQIVGNLAANLAATTLKVRTRYFHRIGVSGKGVLKIYENIKGLPGHNIFRPGKTYPVIVRHSNSLSADDDARIDARGAAIRIYSDCQTAPLLDLTLKTGNAFYARNISDFATWLVCGLSAREEHVKRAPHIRDAVWTSLRNADSFTELHYYSNICRLLRFNDGQEMYVKFKLRPFDERIGEDSGKVEPIGILPPETGAIPRDINDKRPLLFLADDFHRRVSSSNGVRYVFQLQFRSVPPDSAAQDIALDCTKPWDESEFPIVDVGEILISHNLTKQESEELQFNPFLKSHEVDVVRATSASQSASIDHGRSLIYEICQNLRNNEPLPEAWRSFIEQSDVKVDLSSCPMSHKQDDFNPTQVTLVRTWYQTSWSIFVQPLLQTFVPYFFLAYVIFGPLRFMLSLKYPLQLLLPMFWVVSGVTSAFACVVAKWVLVGRKKDGGSVFIWSRSIFMDTIWQAMKMLVGEYFMEMTSGSMLFVVWMKLMGSNVDVSGGVYVDSMGALLNPEMVEIERGGCVGREALLFGHVYEGEGGKVKFGKIKVGDGGFVGSRGVAMPGVVVEDGGCLGALSLAMKEEVVRTKVYN